MAETPIKISYNFRKLLVDAWVSDYLKSECLFENTSEENVTKYFGYLMNRIKAANPFCFHIKYSLITNTTSTSIRSRAQI